MPKSKKSKVISLVAYQSGDETEGSETDQDSNASDQSESETSKHSSDFEIEEPESRTLKRDHETIEISDENEAEYVEDGTKKPKTREGSIADELSNQGSPTVSVKADIELMDTEKIDEVNRDDNSQSNEIEIDKSKFTLEKGFPPGCENIKLPPAPRAPCSQSLQNKIEIVVDRMKRFNYSINNDIHKKKQFKNPSIYEKLIDVYGIDEFGSSFAEHVESLKSDGYMFYDELDSVQRAEWARIDKAKKERTKIEMVSGTKKTSK